MPSHADYFPQNLGNVSHEYYERFHQDMREMDKRPQDGWIVNMIADHCWMLKREILVSKSTERKQKGGNFIRTYRGQL